MTKLQDKMLSTIIENTNFSLFEIGMAYKCLNSFDKLLICIGKAKEEKRPLESLVDEMMEKRQGFSLG